MANSKAKCKYCQDYFISEKMIQQPVGRFCSTDHMMLFVKTKGARDRAEKAIQRARRKATQAARKRLKTLHDLKKEAQAAVNAYIRTRDAFKPCISCGARPEQKRGGTIDAGHYRSRGSANHMRFHLLNIHAQCRRCNDFLGGNILEYRKGLIEKIGEDRVIALENDNELRPLDKIKLERMKKIFRKRTRIYQKLRDKQ